VKEFRNDEVYMRRALITLALVINILLPQPASAAVTVTEIDSARYPIALAVDSSDNIFIGDSNNVNTALQGLVVIPVSSGTIFGQSVTAATRKLLVATTGASPVVGVAVTSAGIVVYTTQNGNIYALSSTASNLFGVSISPNTATLIATGTGLKGSIVFDSTGNLFGIEIATGNLFVIPVNTGTLYGISVTANQSTALYSSGSRWFWDLALDSAGNIFISDGWSGSPGVYVLPKITSNLYGQAFTANTFAKVTALGNATRYAGIHIDSTDTIFVNAYYNSTYVLSSTTKTIFGINVSANSATEIVSTRSYVDQGLTLTSTGDLILGGPSSTLRVRDVALLAQTITFPAISDAVVGSTNTSANATASSGNNVVYRSNTNSVCTIFEGYWNTPGPRPITLLTVGTCSITAMEEGDATYAPAADVTRTFNVTAVVNNNAAAEAARIAAEVAAAKKAKEQKELTEILSLIPELGKLSLNIGDTALAVTGQKCVKNKTIKYVKKGAKCPKGFLKKK
jgi:hypothetical protein